MAENKQPVETIDWSLTTWDGARREALRRWAYLPLERIIAALEEMQDLNSLLAVPSEADEPTARRDTDERGYRHSEPHGEHSGVAERIPLPDRVDGEGAGGIGDVHTRSEHADIDPVAVGEQRLLDRLREYGDRAPRDLIDACTSRDDAMVQAIGRLLDDPAFRDETVDDGEWWLRLHAAMILGLIPGEQAGRRLIDLMRLLDDVDDYSMQDWLAGKWPALFANKPPTLSRALRALAEDHAHESYIRTNAVESCLEFARHDSGTSLDAALDWVASLAAAEDEDWYFRLNLGNTLLDFPRERHRRLLETLAMRQQGFGVHFTIEDIKRAYALGHDSPDWERFKDPWVFYTANAIAARQARWEEEGLKPERGDDYEADPVDFEWPDTYVRLGPKVGRNDPCLCGSGKKYKKCCLTKATRREPVGFR